MWYCVVLKKGRDSMSKRRANGEGMVRKIGKRWEGRIVVGHKTDGSPIFRYTYGKTHPFVQPYRDFNNDRKPTLYEKDIAQWANKHQIFKSCDFADFSPRKGFKCKYYLKQLE